MPPHKQTPISQLISNPPPCVTEKSDPLLRLSPMQGDTFRLGDAFEGTAIFGRSGSGKTSGSGAALARSFLRNGMGGIVMCAKEDEADTWERYAAETGRSSSVIRIDGSGRYRFNFLDYEMQRTDVPIDILTANVVKTLQSVVDVSNRSMGLSASGSGDIFWQKSSRKFLMMAIDLLYYATGRVRLAELVKFINSAPQSKDQMRDQAWQQRSFFYATFLDFYATGGAVPPPQEEADRLAEFWADTFPTMTDKTRSNVVITLLTDLDELLRNTMRKVFCTSTNIVPEMTHDGAVILLDFPEKTWDQTGILAQMIFKFSWMRATERRKVTDQTRPVFLWADECQFFLSDYDMKFQSTARSSRTCVVQMTQNLPSFYSSIGGNQAEHTVNAMMGNLRTKIFHNNDDHTTNEWAQKLVGKETIWRQSFSKNIGENTGQTLGASQGSSVSSNTGINSGAGRSSSYSQDHEGRGSTSITYSSNAGDSSGGAVSNEQGWSDSETRGVSTGSSFSLQEAKEYAVEPEDFAKDLWTGGADFNGVVLGVVVLPGRYFERNGKHWMTVAFPQGAP